MRTYARVALVPTSGVKQDFQTWGYSKDPS